MDEFQKMFEDWVKQNYLQIDWLTDNTFKIPGFEGVFILIEPKEENIIDEDCCLILYDEEIDLIEEEGKIQYIVFEFGSRFYYTKPIKFKNKFNFEGYEAHFTDFKYIGDNTCQLDNLLPFVNLGIHDEYELLNGSQLANDWVKKSVFLKHKSAAVVDRNTLAGTLAFQTACKKVGIKPILGMTASVAQDFDQTKQVQVAYDLKLYVVNEIGWQNLFQINKAINVDYNKIIPEEILLKYSKGIIAVFPPFSLLSALETDKDVIRTITKYKVAFDKIYYQIDTVEYDGDAADLRNLNQIKKYLASYRKFIQPVLINDSYYIDKEMFLLKDYLNKIGHLAHEYSEDQYFKTLDETHEKFSPLFSDGDVYFELLTEMCNNTVEISDMCNYEINTGERKLPEYFQLNPEKSNEELFFDLIQKGIDEQLEGKVDDLNIYMERIQTECDVIVSAGFIDYFLILWDIVDWCKNNGVAVGPGRGCFLPDSKVNLLSGKQVDIKDIVVGDIVSNFYNENGAEVKKIFVYDINEEIIELIFDDFSIKCTKDHKFLTKNRGWVEAQYITCDDDIEEISY